MIAIVAKFIKKILIYLFSKSNRKYQYNHLSKDNSNATDKYRKGDNEKRQNLYFIIFHRTKFFNTLIKSQRGRDE